MTTKATLGTVIFGAVGGGIVTMIVAFSASWVVSAAEFDHQVREARLDALSDVCVARVVDHLATTGNEPDLEGYTTEAREARNELARRFAVAVEGEETASSEVVNACAHDLNDIEVG